MSMLRLSEQLEELGHAMWFAKLLSTSYLGLLETLFLAIGIDRHDSSFLCFIYG